ncbi:hypothetical protein D3C85_1550590 [compost metagenome]
MSKCMRPFQKFFGIFWCDLPTKPILILTPAALFGFGNIRKFFPVIVDLILVIAGDKKRYRFIKLEFRASVDSCEMVAV